VKPSLGQLFGLDLHSYGLLIAVGFALGTVLAAREARRLGMDGEAMLDLIFWVLVTGIAGSRLAFVLLNAGAFVSLCRDHGDCAAPLKIWQGGLIFYGGVLGAAASVWHFVRKQRWPFAQVADVLAPSLALGHAFGRMGCFLAGCCYGKPWSHGVVFPPGSAASDELGRGFTPPLHPTQLYEAAGELAIFFVLVSMRRRLGFRGATALLYALMYGVLRFNVELFRGDAARGFVGFLSTAQVISLLLVAGAGLALRRRSA
jgi:phosphatidylglycerol:prolipoprotein diacylglycerol transferase